jgi:hypothetical protein
MTNAAAPVTTTRMPWPIVGLVAISLFLMGIGIGIYLEGAGQPTKVVTVEWSVESDGHHENFKSTGPPETVRELLIYIVERGSSAQDQN